MDKKQAQMKEQIAMMLAKKDYYDILCIPKTANEAQIKKAYKKLALRFHPDKNSIQGSKEVFKKVSSAYTVLINPEQKQRYDKFGPQQQIQARYRQQHRTHHARHTGDQDFDDFDQIFRAFFGMNGMQMHRNRGARFTQYNFNMGGAGAQNQGQRNQVNTDTLHTPYYAREGFFEEAKKDVNFKKKIDEQVDAYYLNTLKKNCQQNNRLKTKLQYQAAQSRGQYKSYYLTQSKRVDLSACRNLDRLYQQNQQYVEYLFYYR